MNSKQEIREAADYIIGHLAETASGPTNRIRLIVKTLGVEISLAFLKKAQEVEQSGGLMVEDGSRRRTIGGVWFHLIKQPGAITQGQRKTIWPGLGKSKDKPRKKQGGVTIVSITITGRPKSNIIDKGGYVSFAMQPEPPSNLQPCLPKPTSKPTIYVVCVGKEYWQHKGCEQALKDKENKLIVSGYPEVNVSNGTIRVLCIHITDVNSAAEKKAADRAKRIEKAE